MLVTLQYDCLTYVLTEYAIIYIRPGQPEELAAALYLVSCSSYANGTLILVYVAKFVAIVHLESQGATSHTLRGSVLGGLCKHIHMRVNLCDTHVSYCVVWGRDGVMFMCAHVYGSWSLTGWPP